MMLGFDSEAALKLWPPFAPNRAEVGLLVALSRRERKDSSRGMRNCRTCTQMSSNFRRRPPLSFDAGERTAAISVLTFRWALWHERGRDRAGNFRAGPATI